MILSESGELYGWGKNYSNIIDQNTSTSTLKIYDELTQVIYETTDPYKGVTYKEISVMNNGSKNIVMALGDDDYLYMWGETTLIPNIPHSTIPTTGTVKIDLTDSNVSYDVSHSGKVKDFSMSSDFSALILINEDGYLYSIGDDTNNNVAGNNCHVPSNEAARFSIIDVNCDESYNDDDKMKYISLTDQMANAVSEDNYLYVWGDDNGGAVDNGSDHGRGKPLLIDINQDSLYDSNDKIIETDNGNPNLNGAIT
ncbi:MAG: hypothetical protein HRS57_01575 [Mycoplasmataceae bacterium]|nr:hypothetical protein [Mycoplasmataceae bacterium]